MDSRTQTLLVNVHEGIPIPSPWTLDDAALVKGLYLYYHYKCDNINDRGWGCGYRTLQTLCSWIHFKDAESKQTDPKPVPSVLEIQKALVTMGDKPAKFVNSRDWIGTYEAFLCMDHFYNVPSRILHIRSSEEILTLCETIRNHFLTIGSPIMMGGNTDALSKGILGICNNSNDFRLLVLDPHLVHSSPTKDFVQHHGWLRWYSQSDFLTSSFYNLCFPLYDRKTK